MSTINPLSRQMSAKIVYVGPGLSGKTTSLHYIHSRLNPQARGDLVSLATHEDRTLFFDFLPVRIPRIHGLGVRLQLYTVPGQVFYAATRKLVLNGADGVVFVADGQRARREANIESLASTREQLQENGIDIDNFPLVFQYNKRDLADSLTEEELRRDLNPQGFSEFSSVATEGKGVLETLRAIVRGVVRSLSGSAQVRKVVRPYLPASTDSGIAKHLFELTLDASELASEPPKRTSEDSGLARVGWERARDSVIPRRTYPWGVHRSSSALALAETEEPDEDIELEPPEPEPVNQAEVTTERPIAGVSFSALWDPSQRAPIALIESCISAERYSDAVHHAASSLALLLAQLPVPPDTGTGTRAALLGLEGQEYLRLCRLASQPNETVTDTDALFALYLLVSARVKLGRANTS